MADLSAVLRKTIDGLPKATPQLRAKVYEKARAAIARQIDTANPPLSEEVIEARRGALEDAIDRTEDHYLDLEAAEASAGAPSAGAPSANAIPPVDGSRPSGPAASSFQPRDGATAATIAGAAGAAGLAGASAAQKPAWLKASPGSSIPSSPPAGNGGDAPRIDPARRDQMPAARTAPPVAPGPRSDKPTSPPNSPPLSTAGAGGAAGAGAAGAGMAAGAGGIAARAPGLTANREGQPLSRATPRLPTAKDGFYPGQTSDGRAADPDNAAIPEADLAAPRYANGRRAAKPSRSRAPIFAGLAVLLLAGGSVAAYLYQDEVQALLDGGTVTAAATPGSTPAAGGPPVSDAPASTTPPADTDVAALPSGVEAPPVTGAPGGETPAVATAPAGQTPAAGTRQFTQRLMPDGTEVDEGPGASITNAFEEGTNIAAASPESLVPATPPEAGAAPLAAATPPATAETPAATAETPAATAEAAPPQTAALQPDTVDGVPAVAQKAVFYEERSETEQGTQQGGNVVWTVVNESPADGQPPEPAIRAVADVPEENLRLTMTIRRNADATLPASHVIELLFDVPQNFAGGQIANVQRLALKPTEEARGEPLIGVAGKISDGFFIIALNNLAQATQTNLDLMGREQWIDIPLAYATGRRALMSIEKGIPGERVFKEAMDAWAAKT